MLVRGKREIHSRSRRKTGLAGIGWENFFAYQGYSQNYQSDHRHPRKSSFELLLLLGLTIRAGIENQALQVNRMRGTDKMKRWGRR